MLIEKTCRVGVLLLPGFSLMAFAAIVEPLRSANRLREGCLYRWTCLSLDDTTVGSGSGVEIAAQNVADLAPTDFDLVIVCGGIGSPLEESATAIAFIRRAARHGILVAGVSTGSFLLAHAGLLQARRCAVHWSCRDAFAEAFPEVTASTKLFVAERGVLTCAGGTAVLDMMLHYINDQHGSDLARLIADQFIHGPLRQPMDDQRMPLRQRLDIAHPALIRAVEIMEDTVQEPLKPPTLARKAGVSARQLERLFSRHLGRSPTRHYAYIRLLRARKLLRQTSLPVIEVAMACGFTSASHFSKCYRLMFGTMPRADRAQDVVRFAPPAPLELHA